MFLIKLLPKLNFIMNYLTNRSDIDLIQKRLLKYTKNEKTFNF